MLTGLLPLGAQLPFLFIPDPPAQRLETPKWVGPTLMEAFSQMRFSLPRYVQVQVELIKTMAQMTTLANYQNDHVEI